MSHSIPNRNIGWTIRSDDPPASPDLGSLNSGSLVYFRKIPVGVHDYAINPNKQGVVIDVLIERRFTDLRKKVAVSGTFPALMPTPYQWREGETGKVWRHWLIGAIAFDSPEESKPAEAKIPLVCMKIWPTASVA